MPTSPYRPSSFLAVFAFLSGHELFLLPAQREERVLLSLQPPPRLFKKQHQYAVHSCRTVYQKLNRNAPA